MLFQCWMLNMAIIGVALPGPPYISSQASIRRQRWLWGVSGRPSLFQSRRCVSLGQSAQGRRNARVKASLRSTSRNICMDGLFTSKPRMMWARTLYICGLKKGTVYGHVCNDHAGGPSMYICKILYSHIDKYPLYTYIKVTICPTILALPVFFPRSRGPVIQAY